jgi:hypothetical protein
MVAGLAAFQSGRDLYSVSASAPLLPSETGTLPATLTPDPPTAAPSPTHAPPTWPPAPQPTRNPCERTRPQIPTPISPVNDVLLSIRALDITWSAPRCAYEYDFQLIYEASTLIVLADRTGYPGKGYWVSNALRGEYRWRVRACGKVFCSAWSDWWRFTIMP